MSFGLDDGIGKMQVGVGKLFEHHAAVTPSAAVFAVLGMLAKQIGGKGQSHGQLAASLGAAEEQGMGQFSSGCHEAELLLDVVLSQYFAELHDACLTN